MVMILPMTFSRTAAVFDSNRLPSHSTVWAKGQRLRITLTNSTEKSVLIGSKSAIGAIKVEEGDSTVFVDRTGQQRPVRRV